MMDDRNVGALPVCDGKRLIGIITDRNITVRATADGMRPDVTLVQAVMSDDVCWCFEDDPVEGIECAMARRRIRCLPVVDDRKRLVGMISPGELATDLARGTEDTLRSISWLSEPDRVRRRHTASNSKASWPAHGPDSDVRRC
jgi:CBS-domain-containing membrane protein